MRTITAALVVLGLVATVCGSGPAAPAGSEDKKDVQKKPRHRGHITIGKETTRITGPLDDQDYVDYATALNYRMRKGVTPENNANVLLWQALGPHPEGAKMPPEFFRWLGIPAPPEDGPYFIPLSRYLKEQLKIEPGKGSDEIYDQQARAGQRPWTAKDYPHIASWLKVNEKPLAVVVEATKRPQYYSPLVSRRTAKGPAGLIAALLPSVQKCRELASALTARALLRAGAGDTDGAWQDLLACHRLGRLVGRGGTLIEALVGIAIDHIAYRADIAFLDRTRPNVERIKGCLADLRKLPPVPVVADKADLGERFMYLETVMMIDRYGIGYLEGISGGKRKEVNPLANLVLEGIDWDPALKNGNRWMDRLVAALREKDRPTREKKLIRFERELRALRAKAADPRNLGRVALGGAGAGEAIGNILITLLLPALQKVQSAADRSRQLQDNLELAFALAWYQRDHGRYPKELSALAPRYVARAPQDLFAGDDLIYHPAANGYLLYSVGVNGLDDDGRGYDDVPPGDDLVVRMPLPPLPRK